MAVNILTREDLYQFKIELFEELKTLLPQQENLQLKKWLKSDEVKKLLKVSPGPVLISVLFATVGKIKIIECYV